MNLLKKLGEVFKKLDSADGNTEIPAIQNIIDTQSLCDTSSFMKRSKNLFKPVEEPNGNVFFWNGALLKPLERNTVEVKNFDFDVTPNIQKFFTNTKLTTKSLDNNEKETVYNMLNSVGFYDIISTKGLKSAKMQVVIEVLPKVIQKNRHPPLPTIENVEYSYEEVSDDLEGQEIENFFMSSNIIDFYTRVEILLGLKLSGHTAPLTEVSNLLDELYKTGAIQNEQLYRKSLEKFHTHEMELPSKILEQIVFNTKSKIEEHMLKGMDKSTHEEHLHQPLQTHIKQFKIAGTF